MACRFLVVATCSGPAFLRFVSHTVDISYLSVAVCLCPFAEHVLPIYVGNFEFSLHLG
jgi:hypothetical protein